MKYATGAERFYQRFKSDSDAKNVNGSSHVLLIGIVVPLTAISKSLFLPLPVSRIRGEI